VEEDVKEKLPWKLPETDRRRIQERRFRRRLIQYYAPREPGLMEGIYNS
jgi:hypothetical protein